MRATRRRRASVAPARASGQDTARARTRGTGHDGHSGAPPTPLASRTVYAINIRESGGPEVLEWVEQPDPEPGYGEVVVDVVAAGVNRADVMQRQGNYPPPPGAS